MSVINRYLFRGRRLDNGKWIMGYYAFNGWIDADSEQHQRHQIIPDYASALYGYEVDPSTIGQCTGLLAAKSYRGESEADRLIYKSDITELMLPDGDVRHFEVDIRTVIRDVVSHPDFDAPIEKVAITGVVFLWDGYELFPCVDDIGVIDTSKMSIIGTIHDART